jgi:hypothetical protein
VRLGDALDDRQAEADTRVVCAYASASALKRLGKRGNQLWGELLAGVLDREHHTGGVNAGRDPHGALFGHVVDDRAALASRRREDCPVLLHTQGPAKLTNVRLIVKARLRAGFGDGIGGRALFTTSSMAGERVPFKVGKPLWERVSVLRVSDGTRTRDRLDHNQELNAPLKRLIGCGHLRVPYAPGTGSQWVAPRGRRAVWRVRKTPSDAEFLQGVDPGVDPALDWRSCQTCP